MKNLLFTRTVAFVLALFLSSSLFAQSIDGLLETYVKGAKEERLYLHYNQATYAPGDTVWFKAYLLSELYPSEKSKTVYIDWLDEGGNVLLHTEWPVLEASASGQFAIPDLYPGTAVTAKAYTRWMLNFDPAFLYQKTLRVLGKKDATTASKKLPQAQVQFLPEGGDLIAGLKTKLAFKANNGRGLPFAINGAIYNNKGVAVQNFKATHNGMGAFFFTPEAGASYTAKWTDEKGEKQTTALPAIKAEGVSLTVLLQGTRRAVTVQKSSATPFRQVLLVGTMHQTKVFSTTADLSTTASVTKLIPTQLLPTGILTITVFDEGNNPLAERITFVKNETYSFTPKLEVVRYGLNKRAKNIWELQLPDSLQTNLSVSVTDASLMTDSSENIYSHLLLTADLKGSVYKPAQYFLNNSDSTIEKLDLVMLTNGWRRFNWEAIAAGKSPAIPFAPDTAYLHFSGKIYGVQQGRLANENLVAIFKPKDSAATQMLVVPITGAGTFSEPEFIFFDTLNVFYQFKQGSLLSNSSVRFMEDRFKGLSKELLAFPSTVIPFFDTSGSYYQRTVSQQRREAKEFLSSKMLSNVTVQAKTRSKLAELDKRYTSGLFSGADSYQFDLTDDKTAFSFASVFQYLQGRVAGLQINTSGANTSLQWRGGTPSLYLDEMPMEVASLSTISMADVAYIKIFRPPFMGGFGGSAGAIAVYTKRGGDAKSSSKGLPNSTIIGYTPTKEFYSPNYDTFDARHEQRDLRTTLYWNPYVLTSPQNNKVRLSFFNNDVTQAFRVIIEGISKDGQLTHFETIIE